MAEMLASFYCALIFNQDQTAPSLVSSGRPIRQALRASSGPKTFYFFLYYFDKSLMIVKTIVYFSIFLSARMAKLFANELLARILLSFF